MAFGLEQNPAGGGKHLAALVDRLAVDLDRELAAVGDALDAGPVAQRAFDVFLAAGVEQLLEIPIVPRPPELPARGRKRQQFAARLPPPPAPLVRTRLFSP